MPSRLDVGEGGGGHETAYTTLCLYMKDLLPFSTESLHQILTLL